jgi:hypothetical protein
MAGFTVVTNMAGDAALSLAGRVAEQMGYSVARSGDWELKVQKGSFTLSILLGAFIAYCDFCFRVEGNPDRTVTLVLERNTPWWTGVIGVSRIKSRAQELMTEVERAIAGAGAQILHRGTF